MKNGKIWLVLFVILLIANIVIGSLFVITNKNEKNLQKEIQLETLQKELNSRTDEYLENAKEFKYLLETILENSNELKKYMLDYDDIDVNTFEEKLRQKVVRLDILIKDMENEK